MFKEKEYMEMSPAGELPFSRLIRKKPECLQNKVQSTQLSQTKECSVRVHRFNYEEIMDYGLASEVSSDNEKDDHWEIKKCTGTRSDQQVSRKRSLGRKVRINYKEATSSDDSDDESGTKKHAQKRNKKKSKLLRKEDSYSSNTESYTSSDDSSDDRWSSRKREDTSSDDSNDDRWSGRKRKSPEKGEYEKIVENNKAERLAFLKSLQLGQIEDGLKKYVKPKRKSQLKEKPKPVLRHYTRRYTVYGKEQKDSYHELPFEEICDDENSYHTFIKDLNIKKDESENHISPKSITYSSDVLNQLSTVTPVLRKFSNHLRICGLTWYPDPETLFLVAANNNGRISMFNEDSVCNPCVMKTSHFDINHFQFNPWNPTQLLISSPSSFQSADMVRHILSTICQSDNNSFSHFDFISPSTYLIARKDGYVSIADNRVDNRVLRGKEKICLTQHQCSWGPLNSISVHPTSRNFFIVAADEINVWDLRMLQENPYSSSPCYRVRSAFFSPITGNSILCTCLGTSLRIFDSENLCNISLKKEKECYGINNLATWLPNSDKNFSIHRGSCMHVCDENIRNVQTFNIFSSFSAFHPYKPAVALTESSRCSLAILKY